MEASQPTPVSGPSDADPKRPPPLVGPGQPFGEASPETRPFGLEAAAIQNLKPPLHAPDTLPLPLAPRGPRPGAPTRRPLPWILTGLLGVILLAGGLLLWQRKGAFGVPLTRREPRMVNVPSVLQPYVDRAAQGDTQAMRMLGTMYYYGLSVTQDKEEGRRWFRKAAEAGDPLAQKELGQLEAVLPR